MTPQQTAALWLQIFMLVTEQQRLERRITEYERRQVALERRIRRLEMNVNKERIEFSAN